MKGAAAEPMVLFAEVPNFYAEVEKRAAPALSDRPFLVGGDPAKRGKVQSATPDALQLGVEEGMPMEQALRLCPLAVRVPTNMRRYREASGALVTLLTQVFDEVETRQLGTVFAELHGRPSVLAGVLEGLVPRAAEELFLPLRVGAAPSKFLARLAADSVGSQGVRWLPGREVPEFLAPLAAGCLPRVGKKTEQRLAEMGATTVAQVLALGAGVLGREFGNHGLAILEAAEGRDRSPVRVAAQPRTMAKGVTFAEPTREAAVVSEALESLASALASGLERRGLRAARLAVRLVREDGSVITRSLTPEGGCGDAPQIARLGRESFQRGDVAGELYRGLGLTLGGLSHEGALQRQLDLFRAPRSS
ncbi:MAG: hypothetical protein P8Q97_07465 [Myxococcota bacterium]|jgi:DNA polymerase IV|nr:hypothetical protein [Myxococcota bacterium]